MNFNKSLYENRREKGSPLLVAHRGVCGANIPCNTLAAFKIALDQGADVIELDVAISNDGEYFVFHPGMERVFLKSERRIKEMSADEVKALYLVNQDGVRTSYKVPTLDEALAFLKGKVYINVDKFWTDVSGITERIRKAGVEKQVIVKTPTDEVYLNDVIKYAKDLMFMPLVEGVDNVTESLKEKGVNVIGAEILFDQESDEVVSDAYIKRMHDRGLILWVNPIVYNEKAVITAGKTDDISLTDSPDKGWGWLIDKGADLIQTDWLLAIRAYIDKRKKENRQC